MFKRSSEKLSWTEVEKNLKIVNHELVDLINEISPIPDSFTIIKAKYFYGERFINKGKLFLPYKNKLIPLESKELSKDLSLDTDLSNLSFAISLNKRVEKYIGKGDFTLPIKVFNQGEIIRLFNMSQDEKNILLQTSYNYIAGNKSLYLLPKITDERSFQRLESDYSLTSKKPKLMIDQHEMLKELSSRQDIPWCLDIIFFLPKNKDSNNQFYHRLKSYLFEKQYNESLQLQQLFVTNFFVSKMMQEMYLKPDPYIIDIIEHLFGISSKLWPNFFFTEDDLSGPVKFFQNALIDSYQISKYPLFVSANHMNMVDRKMSYFSFAIPSLVRESPKMCKGCSRLRYLDILNDFIKKIEKYISLYPKSKTSKYMEIFLNRSKINFFHNITENGKYDDIKEAKTIMNIDPLLKKLQNKDVSFTSQFFRGVIAISYKSPTLKHNLQKDSNSQ